MALVLLDDCEEQVFGGTGMDIGPARNGNGFQFNASGSYIIYAYASDSLPYGPAVAWTLGFAVRPTSHGGQSNPLLLMIGPNFNVQVWMALNTDGSVSVRRGTAGAAVLGSTPAGVLALGAWAYFEAQVVCHATTGSVVLRVNNTVVLNLSNVNTTAVAGPDTSYMGFYIGYTTGQQMLAVFDDVYACQGASTTPDAFLGDLVVEGLLPTGDGAVNQWLGSDGNSVANWQLVDEAGTLGADYVKDAVVGHQDLYAMANLSVINGSVLGVYHSAQVSKSDVGPAQLKIVNHGTADTKSPTLVTPTGSASTRAYGYGLLLNPDTGSPFTIAEVNALQSGVEIA